MGRTVYHGGEYVPAERATLRMDSIGLRYGVSVFEGVRLYTQTGGGLRPWLLQEHLARLRGSLELMLLADPGVAEVPAIIDRLTEVNGLAEDCYARIAVSAGNPGLLGAAAEPLLTVSVAPMGRKPWLAQGTGLRLATSSWQRPPEQAFPAAAKNISAYAGPRVALLRAKAEGYDNCLLRAPDGSLSEAPTATFFALREGVLCTPRLRDQVLPSITRAWVLAAAPALGVQVAAVKLSAEDVTGCAEAFLCGTGLEFGPVASIDGVECGPDNPVTTRLVARYFTEARGEAAATAVRWTEG
ncbi:aminotransferase class IV [Actinokineospora sp. 24-640]